MKIEKKTLYTAAGFVFAAIFFAWALENWNVFTQGLGNIFALFSPLLVGFCIAFVLNVPMRFLERFLFPHAQHKRIVKLRRPLALVIALCFIVAVLSLVVTLVVPELVNAFTVLGDSTARFLTQAQKWAIENATTFPELKDWLTNLQLNWAEIGKTALSYVTDGASGLLAGATHFVVGLTGGVMQFIIAFIFSIYILLDKENLKRQFSRLFQTVLPAKGCANLFFIGRLSARTFASFVTGQCTEACILGTLCWLGMTLLQFPYAPMIGALVGFTALIPIVGAFIGTFVGAFMIVMTGNLMQAVWFVVFLLVLQQIEGNLIYPRVVGSSVGLPALWVLAAVTVGGSISGIVGMLFAVPVCSVIYALTRLMVQHHMDGTALPPDAPDIPLPEPPMQKPAAPRKPTKRGGKA